MWTTWAFLMPSENMLLADLPKVRLLHSQNCACQFVIMNSFSFVLVYLSVVMNNGKSRGYGFVRFSSENDQDKALIEMQNHCGLGFKPIRVSLAIPKRYTLDGNLILGGNNDVTASSSLLPNGKFGDHMSHSCITHLLKIVYFIKKLNYLPIPFC